MKHYNTGGFYIQLIHCDGEYKSLIDPIRDKLNAEMNFANPGDHVPEPEGLSIRGFEFKLLMSFEVSNFPLKFHPKL